MIPVWIKKCDYRLAGFCHLWNVVVKDYFLLKAVASLKYHVDNIRRGRLVAYLGVHSMCGYFQDLQETLSVPPLGCVIYYRLSVWAVSTIHGFYLPHIPRR